MRFMCWITTVTDTQSEYVILIAFPQQQWLRERSSILRYKYEYITFLVLFSAIPSCDTGAKVSDRSVLVKTALRTFIK
jgi:hypothetical protein